jgi:hypothetical protein
MRSKAADFLQTTRKTDYESMVVARGLTPSGGGLGPASRTYLGLLVIAALVYGAWAAADDLLRPAGSDVKAPPTISAGL